jgi:phosphoribosylaminoimidazole-succinocarboxamide synthase
MSPDTLRAQLPHTLERTAFPGLGARTEGKVRDVYDLGDRLLIVTTDRVSAFDRVLGTIPFKGEILNRAALAAFESTRDIIRNHVIESPDPCVLVAMKCRPFPVELVMRGYVTGSLWRDLQSGAADAYELDLDPSTKKDQRLPEPILTPATKAHPGAHDLPTSKRALLASGAMTEAQLEAAEAAARALFARGQALAEERGLILVDTKYEMGLDPDGELVLIDEAHTPDSSRYWVAEEYEARFARGEPQLMLDKENLRSWLMDQHGFGGEGEPPPLSDDIRVLLAERYVRVFERLTGTAFEPIPGPALERVERHLRQAGYLR